DLVQGRYLDQQESVDKSRRLFAVEPAGGRFERRDLETVRNRVSLATAAQLVGLAQHMLDMSVAYVGQREQFGKPVGSFQAVKHHLADAALRLEFARPCVHRAAWVVANADDPAEREVAVSLAKAQA